MSSLGFVGELARFGGPNPPGPVLHVGRPNVPERACLLERIGAAVDRRWLSNDGPMVLELEGVIAERIGVRHCVAVSSATTGLAIAARAMGLVGDVIVPAFTFVATAHALAWHGARPVFCDVDRITHQLDPRLVEAAITERTTGIMGVHTWGRPCDVAALTAVAERAGVPLLLDAAPAFGATVGGVPIGRGGRAEVVSLHATKVVNAGEGGVILTDDDDVADAARLMRTFGFADVDAVVALGTNAKMSELAAAMGLSTIERYDEFAAVEEAHFRRYVDGLGGLSGVRVLPYPAGERANFHNVVVEIDAAATGVSRDLVLEVMSAQGVLVRRYFWPGCHRMEPYRTQHPPRDEDFPVTDTVASRVLSLPTGTALSTGDVDRVVELLAGIVRHGPEITACAAGRRAVSQSALVTVVVCTYDHERYVVRAMESVLDQEAPFGVDIVVLDDCSTDGTMAELARLAERHPGRFVVRQPPTNQNDLRQFTAALDEATTPFVAMLEGDDYWTSPSKLATQVAHLERNPQYAMSFHAVARVDSDDRPLPDLPGPAWERPTAVRDDLWRGCFPQAASVVFRRSAYDSVPPWYQESLFGDWELYLFLAERGDLGFLPERMSAYRVHAGGVWSGSAPLRRAQQVERFYALAARVDGATFRRNRAATLSRAFSLSYWYREAGASGRAWRWGVEAGVRVVLHRPGTHAPSRREVGRLLRDQVVADRGRLRRRLGRQGRPWSATQRA